MINYLVNHMMIPILQFSYNNIFPNYGVAIVILTLLIKIIFYPLTHKQFAAMKANQKMQPEMKKLQEKYKEDPKRLQVEMMKLWKEHKSNPFSGCLLGIVQIPFFIAIFYTIQSPEFTALLQNAPSHFLWLSDLTQKDHTWILPIFIGISSWLSQKLYVTDPQQQKMMMFLPVIMFVFSIKMPSGVLIYWAVSQFFSGAQQYLLLRKSD